MAHPETGPESRSGNGPTENESTETMKDASPAEADTVCNDELSDLKKQVEVLQNQVKDKENKYLYLYADFENFKKRAIKERSDASKFGWENVARDLLQTVDNLERAVEHMPANVDKNFAEGLKMILNHFRSSMEKQGVLPISTNQALFNPELHEAIGQEPSDLPSGTIIRELTPGYTIHGRLLRPSRVMISSGKAG